MRTTALTVLLLTTLLAACAAPATPGAVNLQASLSDCQLSSGYGGRPVKARCGQLDVPENPAEPGGRRITLHFAVVPAVTRSPAADALFFIPGGPGEAALQSFPLLSPYFDAIHQKRDIVLLDQRGTGRSHPLRCPAASEDASSTQGLAACLAALDADPRFYTTALAAADLEALRAALGYSSVDLYGASYGTRVALEYVRRYRERVRAVILDGAAPPNWTLGPSLARDGQRALDLIFARCAADAACRAAFPDPAAEFADLQAALERAPAELDLLDPASGAPTHVRYTRDALARTVQRMTYASLSAALLPLMIHQAHERYDFRALAAQGLSDAASMRASISEGMYYSVVCSEDVPFFPDGAPSGGYLGGALVQDARAACAAWPRAELPAGFNDAVVSDVPVLILSGEADPVTPPSNGDLAARTLPNSLHVVVPGQGHIAIIQGCVARLAAQFVESGSPRALDAGCAQDALPVAFFTGPAGPEP